jgi:hypothetical protein
MFSRFTDLSVTQIKEKPRYWKVLAVK